jgi:zona occludens toxin
MLIFHEGLPRSGKSYEAVVKHIIPAIASGRKVYARMDGFDKESCLQRIAEVIQIDIADVKSRLIHISADDVNNIPLICSNNSLVVIDEIARYFPAKGKKASISELISNFVKEHGHLGIDILAMDQDLRDVNQLLRRRVDRRLVFMKLDVLGAKGNYKWKLYKAISGENFELVGKGTGKYDKKYFGTYDSHVNVDVNTENYNDERAVIWKRPIFKYGIPLVIIVFIAVPYYMFRLFDPNKSALVHKDQKLENQQRPVINAVPAIYKPSSNVPVVNSQSGEAKKQPVDYIKSFLDSGNRVRLVAVMFSEGREPYVVIELRDEALRVKERLDSFMLKNLGWYIKVVSLKMVRLKKVGFDELIVTPWPIDFDGRLSVAQNDDIRRRGEDRRGNNQRDDAKDKPVTDVNTYQVSSSLGAGLDKNFNAQQYVTLDKLHWSSAVVK